MPSSLTDYLFRSSDNRPLIMEGGMVERWTSDKKPLSATPNGPFSAQYYQKIENPSQYFHQQTDTRATLPEAYHGFLFNQQRKSIEGQNSFPLKELERSAIQQILRDFPGLPQCPLSCLDWLADGIITPLNQRKDCTSVPRLEILKMTFDDLSENYFQILESELEKISFNKNQLRVGSLNLYNSGSWKAYFAHLTEFFDIKLYQPLQKQIEDHKKSHIEGMKKLARLERGSTLISSPIQKMPKSSTGSASNQRRPRGYRKKAKYWKDRKNPRRQEIVEYSKLKAKQQKEELQNNQILQQDCQIRDANAIGKILIQEFRESPILQEISIFQKLLQECEKRDLDGTDCLSKREFKEVLICVFPGIQNDEIHDIIYYCECPDEDTINYKLSLQESARDVR